MMFYATIDSDSVRPYIPAFPVLLPASAFSPAVFFSSRCLSGSSILYGHEARLAGCPDADAFLSWSMVQ